MGGGEEENPGVCLGHSELQRGLGNGYFDIFGIAVYGFDSDGGVSLKGDEFFVEGEGGLRSGREFEGIFCD